ncbi:hypothetical protein [Marinimicrobium locisalis]|uniref:hypothetical protein n=1 Tax=Marinimicrobium locisalis TaxID=546022 RepID=UPI0032216CBA
MMGTIKLAGQGCLAIALTVLLGACGSDDSVVSSSRISTGQMQATLEVYSDGDDSAYASAQLLNEHSQTSGDEYVELLEGDELWFTTGVNLREETLGSNWFESLAELAHTQQLLAGTTRYRSDHLFFFWSVLTPEKVHYNGQLEDVPDGARYTVSLLRDSKAEALESTVTMPRAFDLLSPTSDQTLSRSSDPVQLEWLPTESDVMVEVDVTTTCADDSEYQYRTTVDEDTGALQIEAGDIDAERLSGSCSTTATLTKARLGQLDSAYAGGSISARQVRTVTFTTVE